MDEGPVLSKDVWLALVFYAPTSKNLKEHFERAYCVCFFRYFICFFKVACTIGLGKDIKNLI